MEQGSPLKKLYASAFFKSKDKINITQSSFTLFLYNLKTCWLTKCRYKDTSLKYLYDQQFFLVKLQQNQREIVGTLGDSMGVKSIHAAASHSVKPKLWFHSNLKNVNVCWTSYMLTIVSSNFK